MRVECCGVFQHGCPHVPQRWEARCNKGENDAVTSAAVAQHAAPQALTEAATASCSLHSYVCCRIAFFVRCDILLSMSEGGRARAEHGLEQLTVSFLPIDCSQCYTIRGLRSVANDQWWSVNDECPVVNAHPTYSHVDSCKCSQKPRVCAIATPMFCTCGKRPNETTSDVQQPCVCVGGTHRGRRRTEVRSAAP